MNGLTGNSDYDRLINWMDIVNTQENYDHLLRLCQQAWTQQTFLEVAQALKAILAPFNSLNNDLAIRAVKVF